MANPRRSNGWRRDQLRKRVLAHYTHCAICDGPVDKTLPPYDPGAPEVDEIVPVSLGGDPLAWSNVQLAHRLCNAKRGNRPAGTKSTAEPDKPTPSRCW